MRKEGEDFAMVFDLDKLSDEQLRTLYDKCIELTKTGEDMQIIVKGQHYYFSKGECRRLSA